MAETLIAGGGLVGYLVIAGLVSRFFVGHEDDPSIWPIGFFWPVILFFGIVFGIPVLIVGTIAGVVDPLEPIRDWSRRRQLARARRIADDEAELKRLLELP